MPASRLLAARVLVVFGFALLIGCGDDASGLIAIDVSGQAGTGGGAVGAAGTGGGAGGTLGMVDTTGYPTTCEDLGPEPLIPPACATIAATKPSMAGVVLDETAPDTAAIQAAIDACPPGQSLRLAPEGGNDALLTGPLTLKTGVALWIDAGLTLFGSRNPRDYDAGGRLCGANDTGASACNAIINVRGARDTAVVGAGTIDGRGGEPVIGDPAGQTWWELEEVYDGKLAGPRIVQVTGARDFTLYGVTMKNATKFHVVIERSNGYRVWGITINTPANAPNTDGVDPAASTNGVIAYTKITTGDDNIAVKGTGPPAVDNLIVAHNHFGRGHGMSIGSETYGGVQNVKVCDLSLDATGNGLRIKSDMSRGGVVRNVTYRDVCIRGSNNPLVFDPYYSSATGSRLPDFRDIAVHGVHVLGGGRVKLRGFDVAHPLVIALDNVVFDGTATIVTDNAQITLGPDPVTLAPAGTGVTVANAVTGSAPARACDDAWVTF